MTVYFVHRDSTVPGSGRLLVPVEREVSRSASLPEAAVRELVRGTTPGEREDGLVSPLAGARLLGVRRDGDRAIVLLAGAEPRTVAAGGQLLYTLTEFPGIRRISVLLGGRPCCFWTHDGRVIDKVDRSTLRYWSGEPCHLRTTAAHVRCPQ